MPVSHFFVEGGLVLSVPGSDGLYLLNPTAAFVWQELHSGSSSEKAASHLAEAFNVPLTQAVHDVTTCIQNWAGLPLHLSKPVTTYSFNNIVFSVTLDSPELEAEILPRLSQLLSLQRAPPLSFPVCSFLVCTTPEKLNVYCDGDFAGSGENVSAARAILLQEITRRTYPDCDWLAILHAGACGNAESCVVFPAASHSGKTTLAAALLQSGLTLYADDSVCLQAGTLAIPAMPFALAVREGSWPLLAAWFPAFSDLPVVNRFGQQVRFWHPPPHAGQARAAAVVFSRYQPNAPLSVQPLNTLQALVRFQESGFWVDPAQEGIQAFLNWLDSLPVYDLVYSDTAAAVDFISTLLR